ncbi:hypothetical protein [Amycolatopsis sp. lyj-108]|uniref:hypothetical protein n=1 Tax=Amycolatopsis sp. lyj-108 TaxID=2789286 RepID=UPI0039792E70
MEFTVGQIKAAIPKHFPPVTLWAAVCRIHAHAVVSDLVLSAQLVGAPADVVGGPDPGELLEAVTIQNADSVLTLGGPDLEAISICAETGQDFPRRWVHELQNRNKAAYGVNFDSPATLTWRLPALWPDEIARFCVAAAWRAPSQDPATWYAVDITTDFALSKLLADQSPLEE